MADQTRHAHNTDMQSGHRKRSSTDQIYAEFLPAWSVVTVIWQCQ